MGKIEELQQAIDEQAAKIAEEKQQVISILQDQNDSIAALEEQVAAGGTSEQLQELINKVKANTAELVKIYEAPGEVSEDQPEDNQPEDNQPE